MKFALCFPTHRNCREQVDAYLEEGIDARCYPARSTTETEDALPNCWNPQADAAEALGFPVVKTVCALCPQRARCLQSGYLAELIAAAAADVVLFTHKRAEFSGLADLTSGRGYVSIHENPIDLLRPRTEVSESDLVQAQHLLSRLLNDPYFLDRFAPAPQVDDDGNEYESEELRIRKARQYEFCRLLADLIDDLLGALTSASSTAPWQVSAVAPRPEGIERLLFWAIRVCRLSFNGQPFRFLLAAASGELHSAGVLVSNRPQPGGGANPCLPHKLAIGFRHNPPAPGATTWFNDATVDGECLAAILGATLQDGTPDGRIALQKKAVQIPRDITRKTKPAVVAKLLRGILADRPQFTRVGLITHRPQLAALPLLEPDFAVRIVKQSYFGSGEERSSNRWHEACDLILVAGTPRVPPDVIAGYLMQVGDIAAACREPPWATYAWEGVTESGELVRCTGRGYLEPTWRRAQQSLVRAALVQAIGRGRGILADGCEVLVLSTEECGLPLSDGSLETLNETSMRLLGLLRELTAENVKNHFLTKTAVSTADLASRVGLSVRQTRDLLRALDARGLVTRVGERGGWRPVAIPSTSAAAQVPVPSTEPAPC